MTDANLAFAKLVANPTASAWSQAYDAGKLFAVLSLEAEGPLPDPDHLNIVGKEVLATLEQEFFTLENKDLDSIKRAITTATEKIGQGLSPSFVIVYIVGNILYLFIHGRGKVVLKRGTKIGTLLEADNTGGELKSASGYLQDKDIIILETEKFSKVVTPQSLAMSLDNENPTDIAEALAPNVHEKEEGGAASLFVEYKQDQDFVAALAAEGIEPEKEENGPSEATPPLDFNENENEKKEEIPISSTEQSAETIRTEESEPGEVFKPVNPVGFPSRRRGLGFARSFRLGGVPLPHSRRVLLTVGVIILVIFLGSIFFAINSKNSAENKKLFDNVYSQAQAKYNEGQGLVDLNKSLAREDFLSAQKILNDNKGKFKEGSDQEKQISDLLSKVNEALSGSSGSKEAKASEINLENNSYLNAVSQNKNSNYFAQNADSVFFVDTKGVEKVTKSSGTKSLLFAKNWTTPGGLGVYVTNFYVLDKSDTILKFVPTGTASKSAYVKSDYLTSAASLDSSVALAIDGSVYVMFENGNIDKYNRGAKQSFSLKGLDKNLNKPTKIWTDTDAKNIYILDNGNSRLLVVDKEGNFQGSYSNSLLKNAADFEVIESSKEVNFLSGGKAYSISL